MWEATASFLLDAVLAKQKVTSSVGIIPSGGHEAQTKRVKVTVQRKMTTKQREEILDEYMTQGHSMSCIAHKRGISHSFVGSVIRAAGVSRHGKDACRHNRTVPFNYD